MKTIDIQTIIACAAGRIVGRVGAERIVDFAYSPELHPSAQALFAKEIDREMRNVISRLPVTVRREALELAVVERAEALTF
ncbi:hypothetical protein SEA_REDWATTLEHOG_204 [Gordonia phage RedWattleHog]|uniref:Uncharacterized protein n=1 Tax=Gordonia phage Stormageddon TaxID=2656541 RepID=A0A649VSS9_9CAUD|nr:hypothetical protein KHQ86_gp095 [Gordonia phage Stormageddon]QGJ95065.1 hypothetical protein SEA_STORMAGEDDON_205 [Gordonia phage Stormageddon]QLF83707.1 hypothetical protein SEA_REDWATTLEHOG_204 [Gordonia phage RedWattleHog]